MSNNNTSKYNTCIWATRTLNTARTINNIHMTNLLAIQDKVKCMLSTDRDQKRDLHRSCSCAPCGLYFGNYANNRPREWTLVNETVLVLNVQISFFSLQGCKDGFMCMPIGEFKCMQYIVVLFTFAHQPFVMMNQPKFSIIRNSCFNSTLPKGCMCLLILHWLQISVNLLIMTLYK